MKSPAALDAGVRIWEALSLAGPQFTLGACISAARGQIVTVSLRHHPTLPLFPTTYEIRPIILVRTAPIIVTRE